MKAHNPRTPICRVLIDSDSSCLSMKEAIVGLTAAGKEVYDNARRDELFGIFVLHFFLNNFKSSPVAGRKEQCKRPPNT